MSKPWGPSSEEEIAEAARMDRLRSDMWSLTLLEEVSQRPHVLTDESLVAALDAACGMLTTDRFKVVHSLRREVLARMRREK